MIFEDGKIKIKITGDASLKQPLVRGYRDVTNLLIRLPWARNVAYQLGTECSPVAMLASVP